MTAAETITSFKVLNYSGMLYNKANTKTPFLNRISGNVKYTNSVEFVTGQFYTGEEGAIPAISEADSLTAPTASFVTRTQMTNVTQIFQDAVAISYAKMSNMGTLSGVNLDGQAANPQNELDFQVANKMNKLARSIEKTFIQGTYNKATTDATINKTRGMNEAITTNVIAAGGKTLNLWLVNELMEKIMNSQGDISSLELWTNTTGLNQLNADAIEMGYKVSDPYMSSYGVQVRDLIMPLGIVRVVLGEFIPSGTAYLFNMNVVGPVEQPVPGKGNFFLEPLAKEGAGDKYMLFGQIGLDHGPEWYHGKITGLSTDFVAPEGQKVVISGDVKTTAKTTTPTAQS